MTSIQIKIMTRTVRFAEGCRQFSFGSFEEYYEPCKCCPVYVANQCDQWLKSNRTSLLEIRKFLSVRFVYLHYPCQV